MNPSEKPMPKLSTSHLHAMNLVVALLAGVISITGGIYSLKNNLFSGPAYGSLQGTVRDEKIARPLKLASVEISDLGGAVVNTATTDDNGHYLIEALKTGNYVVKFTAPLHKIETKTIKIEKDLASSINVELFPEPQQANLSPVEAVVAVPQNIRAPYTPPSAYPATAPAVPGYNPSQSTARVSEPSFSNSRPPDFRKHPHRRYSEDPTATSTGTAPSTSQSSALAQAGTQLLETWLNKKTETSSSTSSN
jgi:hypothetical protein